MTERSLTVEMMQEEALREARRCGALDDLAAAFIAWAEDHGIIWFDLDTQLAQEMSKVLGIDLRFESKVRS